LAYPEMAYYGRPLFDTMMAEKVLKKNVFSYFLSYNDEEESELLFGNINPARYEGELKYYPIV